MLEKQELKTDSVSEVGEKCSLVTASVESHDTNDTANANEADDGDQVHDECNSLSSNMAMSANEDVVNHDDVAGKEAEVAVGQQHLSNCDDETPPLSQCNLAANPDAELPHQSYHSTECSDQQATTGMDQCTDGGSDSGNDLPCTTTADDADTQSTPEPLGISLSYGHTSFDTLYSRSSVNTLIAVL